MEEEKKVAPVAEEKPVEKSSEESDVDELISAGSDVKKDEKGNSEEEHLKTLEEASKENTEASEEEKKEEEEKAESQKEMNKNVYVPLPAYPDGLTCESKVRDMQQKFNADMKKSRTFSTIIMAIVLVGFVGAFFMYQYLPSDIKWITWILIGVVAVLLVVAFVLSSRKRKKLYTNVEKYVEDEIAVVDSYVFTDGEFKNPVYSAHGRIDLQMLIDAHYFDTINATNSRNIVKVHYLEREMTVSEIAARVPYQKPADLKDHSKDKPVKETPRESYGVFGKYVTYPVSLKNCADVIVLLQGANAYLPTYLDGYASLEVPNLKKDYLVWSTLPCGKELFTDEVVDILNSFSSDAHLENLFLSINEKGLKICLNYNETVMEIPMDKPLQGEPFLHYRNDIQAVKKLIAEIKKNNG